MEEAISSREGLPAELVRALLALEHQRDEIVKDLLVAIVQGSSYEDLLRFSLHELARGLPELVTELLRAARGEVADPASSRALVELLAQGEPRGTAARLAATRLALLQANLMGTLSERLADEGAQVWSATTRRLAAVFASLQATAVDTFLAPGGDDASEPPVNRASGLLSSQELEEACERLAAVHRRYGAPFAILAAEVEGLATVYGNEGREAGEQLVRSLSTAIREQMRDSDIAGWTRTDGFSVLAPKQSVVSGRSLAERLEATVETIKTADGTSLGLMVGVAACPEHGSAARELLQAVERAVARAKETGQRIVQADAGGDPVPADGS